MVKVMQDTPAEEADKYSTYMEHRLRLATSNDGGKTLGPVSLTRVEQNLTPSLIESISSFYMKCFRIK